jgi:hypothetical protein
VSADVATEVEKQYYQVSPRFAKENGKPRAQWHRIQISQMAEKVGRTAQYETPYSIACLLHHANGEALLASLSHKEGVFDTYLPPSLQWVQQALFSGHTCLLQALDTLNEFFKLGFDSRLEKSFRACENVWRQDLVASTPQGI